MATVEVRRPVPVERKPLARLEREIPHPDPRVLVEEAAAYGEVPFGSRELVGELAAIEAERAGPHGRRQCPTGADE